MTRNDPGLLVVTSSISSQLQNFSCKIHWSTSSNTFRIITFPKQPMDATYWKSAGMLLRGPDMSTDMRLVVASEEAAGSESEPVAMGLGCPLD